MEKRNSNTKVKRQEVLNRVVVTRVIPIGIILSIGCFIGKSCCKSKVEYIEVPVPTSEVVYKTTERCIGEFEITAYCPCKKCCGKTDGITATGVVAKQGRTVAVDPNIIPYDTVVVIGGVEYIAEDCGGAIKGNRIDVFFNEHQDAVNFGRQNIVVYTREYEVLNNDSI